MPIIEPNRQHEDSSGVESLSPPDWLRLIGANGRIEKDCYKPTAVETLITDGITALAAQN